ncbi:Fic family protein [Rhodococcus sp. SBT000017]|nr:Fic family protein [Rhodococcus sp. SBT000017]
MKTPAPPPSFESIARKIQLSDNSARMFEIMQLTSDVATGEYMAWDRLRYKTPPEGLTHEEWWFGVKVARSSLLRPLPLQSVDGTFFSYALPDQVLRLLDDVTKRASGQIAAPEEITNSATKNKYVVSSLIEEAITSSQLEGAVTSRRDAKKMIKNKSRPRNRSEQMILNNFHAMQHISENQHAEFTPEAICELHRIVTDGTLDNPDAAGTIQSDPDPADRVRVYGEQDQVLHAPPPVDELPGRLQTLCEFANAGPESDPYVPPVVRALTVHFMAGYDHYFEDGNGRTARALFYWSMLKQGYWLTEYLTISRILNTAHAQYARSFLLSEDDGGDLTHFIIYHLGIIQRALNDLNEHLERKASELASARDWLSGAHGELNHRQINLLEGAVKNAANDYTVNSHQRTHGVAMQTARSDLYDLERRGFLTKVKRGKAFVFLPAPDLHERLTEA